MTGTIGWKRRLMLAGLVLCIGVINSGCFLRSLITSYRVEGGEYPNYEVEYVIDIGVLSLLAECDWFFGFPMECTYYVEDGNGQLVAITSSAELVASAGIIGLLVDPLVIQVPTSVSGVTASNNNGIVSVPLVVTQTTSFKADANTTVQAEPGYQFLIIELPEADAAGISATDAREGDQFNFTLNFRSATFPIPVKTMFTVRFEDGPNTYYVPMLPCTTSFANVPELSIGFTTGEQDIFEALELYETAGCEGEVYEFSTTPGPPGPGAHTLYAPNLTSN
jgi:hypothetical protein